ncbi:MAG: hypothetical protein P8Y60_18495, partial [Calditrichota bacterium]
MKKLHLVVAGSITFLLALLVGCASMTDAVIGGAVSGMSRAVSERAANAVYKKMAPKEKLPPPKTPGWNQFMTMQAQIVFAYAFAPGGLWISRTGYQPGQYAKFQWKDNENDSGVQIERAYLKKEDTGNQWWRVSWTEGEDAWVYEGLINPSEGELLRLRAKDADGNMGEVPVQEGTAVFTEPSEPSEESIEGATIGKENITTPAGTFNTDHVRYMAATGEGNIDWWIT